MKWKLCCLPVNEGGLGVRSIENTRTAFFFYFDIRGYLHLPSSHGGI